MHERDDIVLPTYNKGLVDLDGMRFTTKEGRRGCYYSRFRLTSKGIAYLKFLELYFSQ